MLFDLRGKRRRLVQVVYAVLAVLFFVSFIGFGIGSDATGGIFDALGIGSDSSSTSSPQFDEDIDKAEEQVAANPKDEKAYVNLTEAYLAAGQADLDQDPQTGAAVMTEDAKPDYVQAVDAWQRYLDLKPKKPDAGLALRMRDSYALLAQGEADPTAVQADLEGAQEAAAIAADANPSQNSYGTEAQFAYFAGDVSAGDSAAAKALASVDPSERKSLQKALDSFKKQGELIQKQLKQNAPTKEELEQPLGGAGGATPAPQPAP